MLLDLVFLIPLLFLGIMTSFSDIKYGKIRNKWIVRGLIYGIVAYFFLGLWTILGILGASFVHIYARPHYYLAIFINTLISFGLAYFLWQFKLWAAGDAKLFMVFAFLIPLNYYSNFHFKYFPSFALLLNIFIFIFIFLVISVIFNLFKKGLIIFKNPYDFIKKTRDIKRVFRKKIVESQKEIKLNYKNSFKIFLEVGMLFLLLRILREKARSLLGNVFFDQSYIFLALFFLYKLLSKFLKKDKKILLISGFIFAGYLIYGMIYFREGIIQEIVGVFKMSIGFMLIFKIGKRVLNFYIRQFEKRKIKIKKLKPKIILTEMILKKIEKDDKKFYFENIGRLYPDGLTEDQTEQIKKWCQERKIEEIEIYKTLPFAPFVFLGALITLIFKGSLFHFILQMFQK